MTTTTRPSRIVYEVVLSAMRKDWLISEAGTRDEAEANLIAHARQSQHPLENYRITPILRKEKE